MNVMFFLMLPQLMPNVFLPQLTMENDVYVAKNLALEKSERMLQRRTFSVCGNRRYSTSTSLHLITGDCYFVSRPMEQYISLEKSIEYYSEKLSASHDDYDTLALRSHAYSLIQNKQRSITDLKKLIDHYDNSKPRNDIYDELIINIYVNNDMLEEALGYCELLLRIDNGNITANEQLVQIYGLLGRMRDAVQTAEKVVRLSPTLRNKIALIGIKAAAKDYSGIILQLKQSPPVNHPQYHLAVADAYSSESDYDNALKYSMMSLTNSFPMSYQDLMRTYDLVLRSLSRLDKRYELHLFANYACRMMPTYSNGYYCNYVYFLEKSDHSAAINSIKRALSFDPNNEHYEYQLSELLVCSNKKGIKDISKANEISDRMLSRNKKSYRAMAVKALISADSNSWSEAIGHIHTALDHCDDPMFTRVLLVLKEKFSVAEKFIIK